MKLLGIEMPLEEFDALIVAQSNGKELKIVDGKVIATEHEETIEEKNNKELELLKNWFDNYFEKQLIQHMWQQNFTVSVDPLFKEGNTNKKYKDIDELKLQAEAVRKRIKELRNN